MDKKDIQKKLRVLKKPEDKINYLKRVLPRTKGETREEGYEILGDTFSRYSSRKVQIRDRSGLPSDFHKAAANAYLEAGNEEKARRELKKSSDYDYAGLALEKLGEQEAARKAYRRLCEKRIKGVQLIPQWNRRGRQQRYKDALRYAIRAGLPVEETSKLRKKIAEYQEKRTQPKREKSKLARILDKVASIILIIGGLGLIFFSSGNFTGYSVSNITSSVNYGSLILAIALILIGVWIWLKKS